LFRLFRPQICQIPICLDHCQPVLQFHTRISEELLISAPCMSFALRKLVRTLPHTPSLGVPLWYQTQSAWSVRNSCHSDENFSLIPFLPTPSFPVLPYHHRPGDVPAQRVRFLYSLFASRRLLLPAPHPLPHPVHRSSQTP